MGKRGQNINEFLQKTVRKHHLRLATIIPGRITLG